MLAQVAQMVLDQLLGWRVELLLAVPVRQWQEGTSRLEISETGMRGSPSFQQKLH